jgi:hypothetical protein
MLTDRVIAILNDCDSFDAILIVYAASCRCHLPLLRPRHTAQAKVSVGSNNSPAERSRPPRTPERYGTHARSMSYALVERGLL